jgi:3,4-dihydroxyphenylacetate 2,3-dioxygenase
MGKLALAAKITHVPSMYLSELDGPRKGTRQDAIDGHIEIGRRCRELGVDTIVVFDTHWLVNANYHINCAPHFKGLYTSNELPHFISNMPLRVPGNPALGQLLAKVCNEHGVETLAHPPTTLAPEYGTLVPMRYMNADQHFKVVSVSALCTVHYLADSARLGWALRRPWKSTTTARWPSSPAAR